jgi:exosortase
MARHWAVDPDYSHGFLIPIIAGYLIWKKKDIFSSLTVRPEIWGLPVLILGLILLIIGKTGGILFTMNLSFLIVLLGALLSLVGRNLTKTILFPLTYLIFMIPLPAVLFNELTFRLRLLGTTLSTKAISLIGIPVLQEGNIIHLSNASLQVVDACSGLRFLITLLALSVLVGYFTQKSTWKRLCLGLLTIPIAIISNAFRITLSGVLAYKYNLDIAEGFFHTYSGVLVFVVAFTLLFVCAVILKKIR